MTAPPANLAVSGLPDGFEAVEQQFEDSVAFPGEGGPAALMSEGQIDDLLTALGESDRESDYSWTTASSRAPPRLTPWGGDDVEDRIASVQDAIADMETTVGAVDGTVSEIATTADGIQEDLASFREEMMAGMSSVRDEIQALSALFREAVLEFRTPRLK